MDGHTFHGLRYDFGSLLMGAGVPDKVVAEPMGHANPAITRRIYQHATDTLQRDAVDRLGDVLADVV